MGILLAAVAVGAVTLAGCGQVEYHGPDSGIDSTLWQQVARLRDPLSQSIYGPLDETIQRRHELAPELYPPALHDPVEYVAGIDVPQWNGSTTPASLAALGLDDGGVLLYDVEMTDATAGLSVFIASGPRSNAPADDGREYTGPSEVYTCYRVESEFGVDSGRATSSPFESCPPQLVGLLADDAAFAEVDVFYG